MTFLWRAAGSPVVNYLMPFTDVDEGAYYAEAVRWAASTGIVTGLTETTFGTDSVCTRAQAAAMIYRCAQAQGKGFTGAWMFHLPFTDVPEWAYESVAWCYMNSVTTGVSETSFAPGNDCTRADRHVPVESVRQVNRRVGSAMPLQEGGDASDASPPFHVCHT